MRSEPPGEHTLTGQGVGGSSVSPIEKALAYEMREAGCRPSVIVDVCSTLRSSKEQLVMLRRVEGWSEREIAREIGSSRMTVGRIIDGSLHNVCSLLLSAEGM